jgi:hypothetical protein
VSRNISIGIFDKHLLGVRTSSFKLNFSERCNRGSDEAPHQEGSFKTASRPGTKQGSLMNAPTDSDTIASDLQDIWMDSVKGYSLPAAYANA